MARVARRFARVEPRRRARAFVLGLLAELPRKNCWTIAEHAGDSSPAGMQHLLSRASWDADEVRDDIRDFVVEHLGNQDAVLVVDETGDLKKGTASVGVQRQYTGTAGARISISARQGGVGGSLSYDSVSARPRCRSCSAGQVRSDPAALR
uniref:transposase n=1 Tax=Streptomyces fagopyri TaxID=2662397 RepID=UPI001D173098|nr:transposase [Streptomyces fagopyri]